MTDSDPARDWTEIDADAAANEFVESMDGVAERGGTMQAKQHSYEQLNLELGDRVLDVGCGQGVDVTTATIQARLKELREMGFDGFDRPPSTRTPSSQHNPHTGPRRPTS